MGLGTGCFNGLARGVISRAAWISLAHNLPLESTMGAAMDRCFSNTVRPGKDNAIQALKDLHPFQCLGEPDDVAYAVVYLASDESRLVNAADLVVDGALLAS